MPKYTYTRYLASKKSVDDRALNQHVWQQMTDHLLDLQDEALPATILELGAGIGTMIERLLESDLLHNVEYTALDELDENIRTAEQRLQDWAVEHEWDVDPTDTALVLMKSQNQYANLTLRTAELFDYLAQTTERAKYDLLIANAFLDLVDAPNALAQMLPLLKPNGRVYFSINFDGATIFEPLLDPAFDARIEQLYHRTMDERIINGKRSGHSQTGRQLFNVLQEAGVEILAAGSSDWVVHATHGSYAHDEAYFLHFIVDTVRGALTDHPELDQDRFAAWIAQRHKQVDAGELVYIAHQLDFYGSIHSE